MQSAERDTEEGVGVSRAPGKVILLGEHAVVYGVPAVACPVRAVHKEVRAVRGPEVGPFRVRSDVPGGDRAILLEMARTAREALGPDRPWSTELEVGGPLPTGAHLGSSAALAVALTEALAGAYGLAPGPGRVVEIAYRLEEIVHGTPSGIDNTVSGLRRPIRFRRGEEPTPLEVGETVHLVIGDTGVRSSTREVVADVRTRHEAEPGAVESILEAIREVVEEGIRCLASGDVPGLGEVLDANQDLLADLGVSGPSLERLCRTAREAGAIGAKLSGAGRGGAMVALAPDEAASAGIARALEEAGATLVLETRLEPTGEAGDA